MILGGLSPPIAGIDDDVSETQTPEVDSQVESIAKHALALDTLVAVAESLTGGQVCARLAAAPQASEWFAGGVVSYSSEVKHRLLGVPPGPVVSGEAARAMAEGVRRTHRAGYSVSLTGAGGPDPQDGRAPGTVFIGLAGPDGTQVRQLRLPGDPGEVCRAAVRHALEALDAELSAAASKMSG